MGTEQIEIEFGTDHCKRGGLSSGGGIIESDKEGTSLTRAETMRDWV